jgi:hypothetical protein
VKEQTEVIEMLQKEKLNNVTPANVVGNTEVELKSENESLKTELNKLRVFSELQRESIKKLSVSKENLERLNVFLAAQVSNAPPLPPKRTFL